MEFLGIGFFLFFGIGCLSVFKVVGVSFGLWEICIIWGFGILLVVYFIVGIFGGYFNFVVMIVLWLFVCFFK